MAGRVVAATEHLLTRRKYHMAFGDLSMTVLMHSCATGNAERYERCLAQLVFMQSEVL